jgi:MFS family permease
VSIEKEHRRLLVAVCTSLFFMPFMMAGVNAVLPAIAEDMQCSARQLSMVGAFYALGLVVFQLAAGSLGDIYGRKRVFLWGMGIFSLTGAVLGFVASMPLFLALRFVQGMGGALFNASGLALLASAAPPGLRAIYLGFSGSAVYAGIACGPPVAGFITGLLGWRWLFWGNAAAAILAFLLMKYSVNLEWRTARDQPFDWAGCGIYAVAMTALTFGATEMALHPSLAWGLLAAFALLFALFCFKERGSRYPLMDVRLLARKPLFALSLLAALVNYSAFFGLVFFFSLYLQVGRGMDVAHAGLFLSLQSVAQVVTTPLAARLCNVWDPGKVCAVGVGLCGIGLIAAAFLDIDVPLWWLLAAQIPLGAGISLFSLPNTSIILESAGPDHVGQAAGLTGAVRTGGNLFTMLLITITLSLFFGHEPVSVENMHIFMRSMRADLAIFGLLNLAAVGCVLARNRR